MTTVHITDMPEVLTRQFGDQIPFSVVQGIYWDGTDWCYRGEVIPRQSDIDAIASFDPADAVEWKPKKV